jgi:hypothetical protein
VARNSCCRITASKRCITCMPTMSRTGSSARSNTARQPRKQSTLHDERTRCSPTPVHSCSTSTREFLQCAGEPMRHAAFVAKGCLRSYVIDATGEEVVLEFAPETGGSGTARSSQGERRVNVSSTRLDTLTSCCSISLHTRRRSNAFPPLRQCSALHFRSTPQQRTAESSPH